MSFRPAQRSATWSVARRLVALALVCLAAVGTLSVALAAFATPAAVAAPAAPAAAALSTSVPAGMNFGSVYAKTFKALPVAEQEAVMADMAAAGVQWLRLDVPFSGQMDQAGNFWWYLDAPVTQAVSRGIQVNALLGYPPAWARNADGTPDIAKFVAYAQAAVAHYGALGVHTFEIMNEVNLRFYFGATPDPAYYAELLKAVYPAIKAVDPSATVITAGLAPAATTADGSPHGPPAVPHRALRRRGPGLLRRRGPPPLQLPGPALAAARAGTPGPTCPRCTSSWPPTATGPRRSG